MKFWLEIVLHAASAALSIATIVLCIRSIRQSREE